MHDLLYYLACVLLPIVWGIVVNWLFNRWERQAWSRSSTHDYQI